MGQDGSGTLTVTLDADADVVEQAGGLADDLRFDDLTDVGWVVNGPVTASDGALQVVIVHDFAAPQELTALLASLNGADGPFKSVSFTRADAGSEVTYTINGTGRVDAGLASFADADLVAAVGATPYADDVALAGLSQSDAVVITLAVGLPGTVERTTGTDADGRITWVIPLDSRPVDLGTVTTSSLDRGGAWSILSGTLQILFVAWIVVAAVFLAYIAIARRRRPRPAMAGPRPFPRRGGPTRPGPGRSQIDVPAGPRRGPVTRRASMAAPPRRRAEGPYGASSRDRWADDIDDPASGGGRWDDDWRDDPYGAPAPPPDEPPSPPSPPPRQVFPRPGG